MKKTIFTMFLLAFAALAANAVPAKRVSKTVMIDGKEVVVTLRGDESCHYWEAADGSKYTLHENGVCEKIPEATLRRMNSNRSKAMNTNARMRSKSKAQNIGEKKGLVILVNFKDKAFTSSSNPKAAYENVVNGINYTSSMNHGSVRDYFRAQSYGKLDFNFEIAGPVTLSHNMSYYGGNDSSGSDLRPATMIWEACAAVDEDVDFSQFDNDGDGIVEQIFVIYAGYGEAQGGSPNTIWPHAWYMSAGKSNGESSIGSLVFDGVTVDAYACSNELYGTFGKIMDGVGTICHEFSHCLGLPDFYCTDNSHDSMTMNSWSIMDNGCYDGNGYTPCSYTAYERWACGWIEPTVLSKPATIKDMGNLDETGEAYVLYNEGNRNEYYVLQNIQKTGWKSAAPGHGMLILHVDYNESAWYNNTPNNNANHLRMTPICADNNRTANSLAGDPYPGTSNNNSLTDKSKPTASLFNANADGRYYMGKPITGITEENGMISFLFDGGATVKAPTNLTATYDNGEITATWTAPEEDPIAHYNLKYGVYDEAAQSDDIIMADEDFSKCVATADKSADIGTKLDLYLNLKGCTGTKLYQGIDGLKVSSGTVNGCLKTPILKEEGTGTVKVVVGAVPYKTDASKLSVRLYNDKGELLTEVTSNDFSTDMECEFEVPENYQIALYATKRLYLNKFQIISEGTTAYTQETLVSGITTTPYSFAPAMSAKTYWLSVQSVGENEKASSWTEPITINNAAKIKGVCNDTPQNGMKAVNLAGQRVDANDYHGIVIINGRKLLK